jgi:hypothetical protein
MPSPRDVVLRPWLKPVPADLAAEAHDYLLKPAIVRGIFDYWCQAGRSS